MSIKTRKKLIEVALPLEKINEASAREKSIRHGHPSTLHLWWARRPLAAARAVIFAQMVDDPSTYVDTLLGVPETRRAAERELKKRRELWTKRKAEHEANSDVPEPGPEPTLEDCAADIERQRLFRIIEELVQWENTTNEDVLQAARDEIWQSWRRACADNAGDPRAKELFDRNKLPAFHDPFAGGGALPLEAQRLGLEAYASDLNPVAVLINKAMIEIPPKFAGRPPVNPESLKSKDLIGRTWTGAQGLAEDVRYYGRWMRDEAEKRIGHLYPKIAVTDEMAKARADLKPYVGQKLTVIAWLWARTVKSPNPAFADVSVPLASTFMLSSKAGKEAYLEPIVRGSNYDLRVKIGKPKNEAAARKGTRTAQAQDFFCLVSGVPIPRSYIREQAKAGRMGAKLMAVIAEGERGRIYIQPTEKDEELAISAKESPLVGEAKTTFLSGPTPTRAMITGGVCSAYGLSTHGDLFTDRQIVCLTTLSDLVSATRDRIAQDAHVGAPLHANELRQFSEQYAKAIAVYLCLAVSRQANRSATLNFWDNGGENVQQVFGRQAFAMTWDFVESNPFSSSTGNFFGQFKYIVGALNALPIQLAGTALQADAQTQKISQDKVISTDPPYYDNINYADLSDFFYNWLRRSARTIYPEIFSTMSVPKAEELIAIAYRHGSKAKAEAFFLNGMTDAMSRAANQAHPAFPTSIYYAFKQSESNGDEGAASTGWETFIDAVMQAGYAICGTWPMRTEYTGNLKKNIGSLASSIVLICRKRNPDAAIAARREFVSALKNELPSALAQLQRGNIAPVDLAQAAIGPGMAVFTRYAKVLNTDGNPVSVREALALINTTLDEVLAEQEGDFDADSRWALAWFDQNGFDEGDFGIAETLSKAKNTSVSGLANAGILESRRGKVRLLRPEELYPDWDPATDPRLSAWEIVHHLVRALAGGEAAAAALAARLGSKAEIARELAYRLYNTATNKKRAAEALAYNGLVQSWPEIVRLAREQTSIGGPAQSELLL